MKNIKFYLADNYEQLSQLALDFILEEIKIKPDLLMCTATGETPRRTYELLSSKYQSDSAIFKNLKIMKLDEWGGLLMDNSATCEFFLQKLLIKPMNIDEKRFFTFESNPKKPKKEIKKIQKVLSKEGPIDLCILGMGLNGHLGFNEPASSLKPYAHLAKLADTTKKHTMAQQAQQEIKYGITLGMADIMNSKKIILLVNGAHKKEVFKKFLSAKITSRFTASMLWMHPCVQVICDKELIEEIPNKYK